MRETFSKLDVGELAVPGETPIPPVPRNLALNLASSMRALNTYTPRTCCTLYSPVSGRFRTLEQCMLSLDMIVLYLPWSRLDRMSPLNIVVAMMSHGLNMPTSVYMDVGCYYYCPHVCTIARITHY